MNQHNHSSMSQSNDEQISQKPTTTEQQDNCTIETCTMDPCPMKTESKDNQSVKCPACDKTNEPT